MNEIDIEMIGVFVDLAIEAHSGDAVDSLHSEGHQVSLLGSKACGYKSA